MYCWNFKYSSKDGDDPPCQQRLGAELTSIWSYMQVKVNCARLRNSVTKEGRSLHCHVLGEVLPRMKTKRCRNRSLES